MERTTMRYVGFYWTFPARWAGFVSISRDPAEAARQSKTIAYQREVVRRYVVVEKGELVGEVAALETSPDRGTESIIEDVAKVGRLCSEKDAILLWVDFRDCGWRPHRHLVDQIEALRALRIRSVAMPPDEIMLGGRRFEPEKHFSHWRINEIGERETRKVLVPEALRRVLSEVPEGRGRYGRIASLLNSREVPTLGGGTEWRSDNVRKAVAGLAETPVEVG